MTAVRLGVVERAFEIARAGQARDVAEIAFKLSREGYYDTTAQLGGRTIRRQLFGLLTSARDAVLEATPVSALHGIYRLHRGGHGRAIVSDGVRRFEVMEDLYRAKDHTPPFETLPNKREYDAA